jgi:hypothetical protein
MRKSNIVAGLLMVVAIHAAAAEAQVALVVDGQPRAVVVLPAEPAELERQAAEELVEHVRLISGAQLPVVDADAVGNRPGIFLGSAADAALDAGTRAAGDNPSSFTLRVTQRRIDVRGLADEGTLFGVYELLEQLGVRWYMPGELGRVVPKTATVRLKAQTTVQAPSFDLRVLQHLTTGDWPRRVRLGGAQRPTGSHGIPPFTGRSGQQVFDRHPEYFALIGGQRQFRQICASNPGAVALAVEAVRARIQPTAEKTYIGMGPNDGGGYCECDNCRALDGGVFDPVYGEIAVTGRYIWFFNQVLAALDKDYPQLHLVWYVYARHMMPPPPELKPNPRIVGVFAPITLDRIRGMDNPMSPDRHILRWIIDQWRELELNECYYRGYYNNLACPQFPLSQVDRIRHETPAFRQQGINVMRVEVIRQSWASNAISLYLATRMMWNVNTDVDALLDEFYAKFYGPAREPMKQYHEALDAAFRDTPYFTGSSYVYFPIFLDQPRREQMRALLSDAAQRSGADDDEPPYAERVRIARAGFDRMELFLDMIEARNQHDYRTAHQKMQQYYRLTDELVDYVLEGSGRNVQSLVHRDERSENQGSYFNRFFERAVSSGHHRTVETGELVTGLPDEWDFLLDPNGLGELGGWQRPGPLGGNWQRLKTSSRSWSDQGLHYYKGAAWYRTDAVIPERFRGRKIYLWFGGVDNVATVWVNGQLLGTSREPGEGLPGVPGSFRPFDVDATAALRFGPDEPNTVTVRVVNDRLSELGTGGITAPVMFWSPR